MSFEKFKTVLLNVLVLLSIFLTYQLWTIQPNYEPLDHLETVEKVMLGPERKLSSIIQPVQAIFHFEGDHVGSYNLNGFQRLYQLFLDGSYTDLQEHPLDRQMLDNIIENRNSVEFVYPDGIPMSVFSQMLDFNDDYSFFSEIERVVLFEQTENRLGTKVWFISYKNNSFIEARLKNHSFSKYQDLYVQNDASFVEVSGVKRNDKSTLYFPKKTIKANRFQAYPIPIEENNLIEALFPDPSVVRQSNRENNIRTYTDGSRELKMYLSTNDLTYINPTRGAEQRSERESDAVLQVFQFVNSHGGFTNPFLLLNVEKRNERLTEIEFHLNFNGYPTFGAYIGRLNVVWQDSEVFEYHRSMNIVQDFIYEESDVIELPSEEEITNLIEGSDYNLNEIENITLGYTINEHDEYIVLSPSWFIQRKGTWEVLRKEA